MRREMVILCAVAGAPLMAQQSGHPLQPPFIMRNIYPDGVDAKAEIKDALATAQKQHKRVLLVFGANWCGDCHVLDNAFRDTEIAPLVEKNFEVVHVDVGKYDRNLDLAKKYDVPLEKGVPAIAVLEADGKMIYSQKHGEFEAARRMNKEDVIAFLKRWSPS